MPRRIATFVLSAALFGILAATSCSSSGGSSSKLNLDGVAQNGATLGNGGLAINLYENLQCTSCAEFSQNVLPQLVNHYIKTGKVQLTFKTAAIGSTPENQYVHEAALCAADQNKIWKFIDIVFKHRKGAFYTKDELKDWADEAKLDRSQFDPCLDSDKYRSEVQAETEQLHALAMKILDLPILETDMALLAGTTSYHDVKFALDEDLQSQGQ